MQMQGQMQLLQLRLRLFLLLSESFLEQFHKLMEFFALAVPLFVIHFQVTKGALEVILTVEVLDSLTK